MRYELFGIEMPLEEFDALMVAQNNGKELKVVDGKVVAVDHENTQEEILRNELESLFAWFNEYDNQVKQFNRCQRLGIQYDMDITELDNQAKTNAERITKIRDEMGNFSDKF